MHPRTTVIVHGSTEMQKTHPGCVFCISVDFYGSIKKRTLGAFFDRNSSQKSLRIFAVLECEEVEEKASVGWLNACLS